MALHSKKTMFMYREDPSMIPSADLKFQKYSEFCEELSEQQLVEVLLKEFESYKADRLEEVSVGSPNAASALTMTS